VEMNQNFQGKQGFLERKIKEKKFKNFLRQKLDLRYGKVVGIKDKQETNPGEIVGLITGSISQIININSTKEDIDMVEKEPTSKSKLSIFFVNICYWNLKKN